MDENNAKSAVSRRLLEHTLPAWDELPDFELYMDQVLSLTGRYLEGMPNSEDSKLTASMINNYVKVKIIPAPQGKRYSRRHVAYLLLLCILKPVLPIAASSSRTFFAEMFRSFAKSLTLYFTIIRSYPPHF